MARSYIPRMVNLEEVDYHIVRECADDKGLGEKGFSAALRLISTFRKELSMSTS